MAAFATTAPLESDTVPVMTALSWAQAPVARTRSMAMKANIAVRDFRAGFAATEMLATRRVWVERWFIFCLRFPAWRISSAAFWYWNRFIDDRGFGGNSCRERHRI